MSEIKDRAEEVIRTVFDNPEIAINRDMTAYRVEGWGFTHIQLVLAIETKLKAS